MVRPDGILRDQMRLDWGYWESKDEADDIDEEIRKKFAKGYPNDNILFEDSNTAVLYQHGSEVGRVSMQDEPALDKLLTRFISYERPEVKSFRAAIEAFKQDVPKVTEALHELLNKQEGNAVFEKARAEFLKLAREAINKDVTPDDVREMLIQHILTADIFNTIFDDPHFHQENNVARELEKVTQTFFTGVLRRQTLGQIKHYYDTINARAAGIADHHEKQKFLKVVYETFYKSYNPKAADRLGVVYTPGEIVRFMLQSTDWLLHRHFGKFLEDKGVDILDPATGTGTFITDLIDHIRTSKLPWKYQHEIHANEVAILPYYISNLNIEATYKQKTGQYAEFENLCFVDTLDNLEFKNLGRVQDMFATISEENSKRILRQNSKKISVVIGNPPYNANQQNENDNNKNRAYPEIDRRIKETFIEQSTAQKTKMYDMYARFYRWAFDRLHDKGIVAFVTNRSFIDSRTFDGFRKTVQSEFDFAYIIDTKSDVRANPKISGTGHNVFGIQTGVAVMFLVKLETTNKRAKKNCQVQYVTMDDFARREEKLAWFAEHRMETIDWERLQPDKQGNWIGIEENDWYSLLPIADKTAKSGDNEKAIFKMFSLGVATNRDEWVYDFSPKHLEKKVAHFVDVYNNERERWHQSNKATVTGSFVSREIKWTSELESYMNKGVALEFNPQNITKGAYRPFVAKSLYFDRIIIHRPYQNIQFFGVRELKSNQLIAVNTNGADFFTLATDLVPNNHYTGDAQVLPLWVYDSNGNRIHNITDWGRAQFQKKYGKKAGITKEDIFHYVYAVLHHPAYREKYAQNLKRDFPRIPLYNDFAQWAAWGNQLMELHLNYEKAEPYPLEESLFIYEAKLPEHLDKMRYDYGAEKPRLKALKDKGVIEVDGYVHLYGVPLEAWEYKLGNRSALEWILDQYKESTPKDPTVREKFNTYRFADYKEHVIDLLKRVTTVSVETMKIIGQMP